MFLPEKKIPLFHVVDPSLSVFPLSMGLIKATLEENPEIAEQYQFFPLLQGSINHTLAISKAFGPGVWLFSNYLWSIEHNLEVARLIKQNDPQNIMIFGGHSIPVHPTLCHDFMTQHPQVDIAVRGEGEVVLIELLLLLSKRCGLDISLSQEWAKFPNITVSLHNGEYGKKLLRTLDGPRIKNPDVLGSPYLNGVFDALVDQAVMAVIESDRGCPHECAFCSWGPKSTKEITFFNLDRIQAEIDWAAKNKIPMLYMANANFGVFDRDIKITEFMANAKQKYGFPISVDANFEFNGSPKIIEIINIIHSAGILCSGAISIQTTNKSTLQNINRRSIQKKTIKSTVDLLKDKKLPIVFYLMTGLPGATMDQLKMDLQLVFDFDVNTAIFRTVVLPNSPMGNPDYQGKFQIKTDPGKGILSSYSFSPTDMIRMCRLIRIFSMAENYSLLRYVLRYLQWDHSIGALEFLHALAETLEEDPGFFSSFSLKDGEPKLSKNMLLSGNWDFFFAEIAQFALHRFSVAMDSGFRAALVFNSSVLPDPKKNYPATIDIEHDFISYFQEKMAKNGVGRRLDEYSPSNFSVRDPLSISNRLDTCRFSGIASAIHFELQNPLMRPQADMDAIDRYRNHAQIVQRILKRYESAGEDLSDPSIKRRSNPFPNLIFKLE